MSSNPTTSSSSSGQQPVAQLLESPALPPLLQHPSIAQQQEVTCKLLPVSHTLCAAVAEHCSGQLRPKVMFDADDASLSVASCPPEAWIAKHGALLQSLVVFSCCDSSMASALQTAADAVGPSGLQLAYVDCQINQYPAVLRQLPSVCAAHLTRLCMGFVPSSYLSAALVQLTALRELQAHPCGLHSEHGSLDPFLSALASLRQLTLLDTSWHEQQLPRLAQLPTVGLQQLRLSPADYDYHRGKCQPRTDASNFLKLAQLTALTSFEARRSIALQDGDELPTSLQKLQMQDVWDVKSLLQLRQLSSLQLSECQLSAQQLLQLGSSLSYLQNVQLHYRNVNVAAEAAAGWGSVELKELAIVPEGPCHSTHADGIAEAEHLNSAVAIATGLAYCTGITTLRLGYDRRSSWHDLLLDITRLTPSQLAGALQQLTTLQELTLHINWWASVEHGFGALASGISCLTALHCLHLDCMPVDGGNAACLSALCKLTKLVVQHVAYDAEGMLLHNVCVMCNTSQEGAGQVGSTAAACSADWDQLIAALGCLLGLRHLELLSCKGLAAVDTLVEHWQSLQKLTHLTLQGCGLVDKCVECLSEHSTGLASIDLQQWVGHCTCMRPLSLPGGDPGCITDAGLSAVARQLQFLTDLIIVGASVTDAGLQGLSALDCVGYVCLSKCVHVTDGALRALKAQQQRLIIYRDGDECVLHVAA